MYLKENINPKGWKCGDCVIRACAKASGKSWDDTYNALYEIGFKKKRLLNDDCCFNKFLEDEGFTYMKAMRNEFGEQLTVGQLADYYSEKYPDGFRLVIHTRRHLTCVVDGNVIDSWNTSYEKAGYYYFKK